MRDGRVQVRERLGGRRVAAERPPAGQELERHDRERVPVARGRRLLASRLLRGDVPRGAEHGARLREHVRSRRRRDPEVRDMDVAVAIEEEVRGLDVAMDDAARMRAIERVRRLLQPGERLGAGNAPAAQALVDGAALEVLHDDERSPVVLVDVEDGHDVRRSREARGRKSLPAEARASVVLPGVPVGQHLDRNRPLERGVGRAVDLTHPSASDEVGGGVPPREHVWSDPE